MGMAAVNPISQSGAVVEAHAPVRCFVTRRYAIRGGREDVFDGLEKLLSIACNASVLATLVSRFSNSEPY